jgi:addiction module HigA family antidote
MPRPPPGRFMKCAQAIGVPANRISAIVPGERNVTADTALRLARALGITAEFWLNLQQSYELRLAEQTRRPLQRSARFGA